MSGNFVARGTDYDVTVRYDKIPVQIPSAASDVYSIICVTHGSMEFWVEDQYYKASGGDILLVPIGAMLGSTLKQRGTPSARYVIWLGTQFLNRLLEDDKQAGYAFEQATRLGRYLLRLPMAQFEELYGAIETAVSECNITAAMNDELAIKAAITTMLVKLNRMVHAQGDDALRAGDKNRLAPVLRHIHDHCTEALTVDKMAEQFEYSPSHLAHSFKKQMGTSLYHYVLLRRLQIGRNAMLKGTPVKEAYQQCGFGDYAGFYRAFTKEFGLSPQQYKKRNQ